MQAGADAQRGQQLDRPVLEDAGAHATLDVLAAAGLEHDGVDSLQVEELRQHEAGRARADDRDLRAAHVGGFSARTCCATAKAELAAGTPQ